MVLRIRFTLYGVHTYNFPPFYFIFVHRIRAETLGTLISCYNVPEIYVEIRSLDNVHIYINQYL